MSTEETQVNPDAEVQDVDTGVDNESNDSSAGEDNFEEKYQNQKVRAEKAESKLKELLATLSEDKSDEDKEEVSKNSSDSDIRKELDELKLSKMGYADEVAAEIMKLGGPEALSNPLVQKSADALQKEYAARVAANIPEGSQSASQTRYSAEDLAKMSSEEMEKILPHADK